ncbi:hypothetical protein XENOCAPTIV_011514, partial [Xenoophorus captivus]
SSFATCCSAMEQLGGVAAQISSIEQLFSPVIRAGRANGQPAIIQNGAEEDIEKPVEDLLKPGHLTRLLEEELEAEVEALSVGKVNAGVSRLLICLRRHRDSCHPPQLQREFDENEVDPYHGQQDRRPEPEAMELPEDLNLDQDEEAGEDEECKDGQTGEENIQSDTAVELAGAASERDQAKESFKRKPGLADNERSAGDYNERINKRLRTMESSQERTENRQTEGQQESELYEHIKHGDTAYDTQTYGVESGDIEMHWQDKEDERLKDQQQPRDEEQAARSTESTIHTVPAFLLNTVQVGDQQLLSQLPACLVPVVTCVWLFFFFWLILRGDYRTGKRLNMRKVIPYIASQFRKDKIWLRRTKPSKREYQICLAMDDSSSMVDNHSKQVEQPCYVA